MNKFLKLIILICLGLKIQAMQKPFSKIPKAELKRLILKSMPYSYVVGEDETKCSTMFRTHLLFLNALIECKQYNDGTPDYCSVTDWDSGENIAFLDEEARTLFLALYGQRIRLAGLSPFEIERRKRGFEEAKKLLSNIWEISLIKKLYRKANVLKADDLDKEILSIVSPITLSCERIPGKKGTASCNIGNERHDFDGNACWEILEELLAEWDKQKKEAELK